MNKKFQLLLTTTLTITERYYEKFIHMKGESLLPKGNANKKYEDNTSSSSRHSPEWKDICHAARLR